MYHDRRILLVQERYPRELYKSRLSLDFQVSILSFMQTQCYIVIEAIPQVDLYSTYSLTYLQSRFT